MTMIGGNTQNLIPTLREQTNRGGTIKFDRPEKLGYMRVMHETCNGTHRFFVAETFAVEGEGTVGAVVICTACGESKVIIHKVANPTSSISLKEK